MADDDAKLIEEAERALHCLYIAVAQPVATDVEKKVGAVFAALKRERAAYEETRAEIRRLQERVRELTAALRFLRDRAARGDICEGDILDACRALAPEGEEPKP